MWSESGSPWFEGIIYVKVQTTVKVTEKICYEEGMVLSAVKRIEDYHIVLERIPPQPEPSFEEPTMQQRVWGRQWGITDDVGPLRLVLLHRPGDEVKVMCDPSKYDSSIGALIDDEEQWYFRSHRPPDLAKMQEQHDNLASVLREEGVEVAYIQQAPPGDPKAMFVRDVAVAVKGGAVICRMGPVGRKRGGRRGEELYATQKIASLGMPIIHTIHGTGLLEGGSVAFLDEKHAVIGMSFRQNKDGADQLEAVLERQGVKLIRVPLTGHSLHIDGGIVMVAPKIALVNITRLPYWFLTTLKDLGIQTVHVDPDDEFAAINCLAVRPGRVIMSNGGERTAERLARLGIEVIFVDYSENLKNGGGIHCSTLPLVRDPS